MTDTPPMLPAEPEAPLEPAHRAGAGLPGTALDAAIAAGWQVGAFQQDNVRAVSPDGDLCLFYLPEADTEPLWLLTHTGAPKWRITADEDTPAEFIAALIAAITTAGPLDPDRDQV